MNLNTNLVEFCKVYPGIKNCSIQTFNDQNKEERSQSRILEMTTDNLNKCAILQTKLPYGIFFSVNHMEKGKRNRESVKAIITRICDIDTGTKQEQLQLIEQSPIKPSLVVESNHGFHLYYLSDKVLSEEEYENGNWGLKNYYNGDAKVVKDTARVLRLPGYYHCKGDKYMVEYRKDLSSQNKYSPEDMLKAFPNQTDTNTKRENTRLEYNKQLNDSDSFWSKCSELSSKQMLEELSGTKWLGYDDISFKRNSGGTEQIYCNGKSTGCWIDANGLIGSADNGGPTWIQRLKWYGVVDWGELARYLKEKHPELEVKKEVKKLNTADLLYKINGVPKLTRPDFTWGTELLDANLGKLSKGQFVILCGETGAGKTTYATFMARMNKGCAYLVLEDKIENIAMRYAIKRAGITKDEYNKGTYSDDKLKKYEDAYLGFQNSGIQMVDIGTKVKVEQLIEVMEDLRANGCNMFFIDNLGFVIGNGESEERQTADASNKLLAYCINNNVCIVLLHHFKKKANALDTRGISQMRGSGKLGDDAYMVVEYMRDEMNTYLKVYKDRTWGDIDTYEITYNRGDFEFKSREEQGF